MSTQRNQVNVRLDDVTNAIVNRVATSNRISKSEVVRLALTDELARIDERKNKTLSAEEREIMIGHFNKIATEMSRMHREVAMLGNNVNQIARAINRGESNMTFYDLNKCVNLERTLARNLEIVAKEMDRIWHTLV